MAIGDMSSVTRTVRDQYQALPYPHRDPDAELHELRFNSLDDLPILNMHCFGGRRDMRSGFRVLVAGGGTGDSTIYLAEQLRHADATIVHLDLSSAASEVAAERAHRRGLKSRIQWIEGSLLDVARFDLAPFDYINCSGVLHHLEDPLSGLKALRSVLKPDGALGLMLYGKYGRSGVYQVQELLRLINRGETDRAGIASRLKIARQLVRALPTTNWYKRGADLFTDIDQVDDNELYDLLLHAHDRAFTVPELYTLLAQAELHLVDFGYERRALYDASLAFQNLPLLDEVRKLPLQEQQAAAELHWGCIRAHTFWASPLEHAQIDLNDPENIPSFSRIAQLSKVRESILKMEFQRWSMGISIQPGVRVSLELQVVPAVRRFVELVDGELTMGEIVAAIAAGYTSAPAPHEVWRVCRRVIDTLMRYDLLLLRHRSSPALPQLG